MAFKNIIKRGGDGGGGNGLSGGDVTDERLQYDNLTTSQKSIEKPFAIIETENIAKKASDFSVAAFASVLDEDNRRAEEFVRIDADIQFTEQSKPTLEEITIDFEILDEISKKSADATEVSATVNAFPVSGQNTGWANPQNALGDTANTAATLTASSSGLLGGTSNTTNGDLILDLRDINIGDLVINTALLRIDISRENEGLLSNPQSNIAFQISFDNGSSFGTYFVLDAELDRSILQLDLLPFVQNNPDVLSQILLRAVGSVTSGAGLGASTTASIFRKVVIVLADQEY